MWARGLKCLHAAETAARSRVASRVGAGIEIIMGEGFRQEFPSRPVWARGLKFAVDRDPHVPKRSRPVWARGLKFDGLHAPVEIRGSRPVWARGLKSRS